MTNNMETLVSPDGGFGLGPDGKCVCPKCNYTSSHQRGNPCYQVKCPKCGTSMVRK